MIDPQLTKAMRDTVAEKMREKEEEITQRFHAKSVEVLRQSMFYEKALVDRIEGIERALAKVAPYEVRVEPTPLNIHPSEVAVTSTFSPTFSPELPAQEPPVVNLPPMSPTIQVDLGGALEPLMAAMDELLSKVESGWQAAFSALGRRIDALEKRADAPAKQLVMEHQDGTVTTVREM